MSVRVETQFGEKVDAEVSKLLAAYLAYVGKEFRQVVGTTEGVPGGVAAFTAARAKEMAVELKAKAELIEKAIASQIEAK